MEQRWVAEQKKSSSSKKRNLKGEEKRSIRAEASQTV